MLRLGMVADIVLPVPFVELEGEQIALPERVVRWHGWRACRGRDKAESESAAGTAIAHRVPRLQAAAARLPPALSPAIPIRAGSTPKPPMVLMHPAQRLARVVERRGKRVLRRQPIARPDHHAAGRIGDLAAKRPVDLEKCQPSNRRRADRRSPAPACSSRSPWGG